MFYASLITYIWTVTLVRTAILLLYRRIFDVKPFRRVATVLIVLCLIWGVSVCFANIFQCRHVPDAFNSEAISSPDDRCINLQNLYFGTVGTGFALDLIILVLPFQQIWGLRLERRQKYELIAILSLGGLYVVSLLGCSLSEYDVDNTPEPASPASSASPPSPVWTPTICHVGLSLIRISPSLPKPSELIHIVYQQIPSRRYTCGRKSNPRPPSSAPAS